MRIKKNKIHYNAFSLKSVLGDSKEAPIYRVCYIGSKVKEIILVCSSQIALTRSRYSCGRVNFFLNMSLAFKWNSENLEGRIT